MSAHPPTSLISLKELPNGTAFSAQFNPASLQYAITNTAAQSTGNQPSREVADSVGKLTLELLFDTTHDGSDVRVATAKIAAFMKPGSNRRTPCVRLEWGAFAFEGALEQYQETLDFFSANGVPLRATLALVFTTVTDNNQTPPAVFAFASNGSITSATRGAAFAADSEAAETYEVPAPGRRSSAASTAQRLGDAGGARAIGLINGLESLRGPIGGGALLNVSASITLSPPIAFSVGGSAGAGAGMGIGGGLGVSGGLGVGLGVGASAGVGASFGAGGSASFGAGGSASFGASGSASLGVSGGASFGVSGSASFSAGASAGASFGAGASLSAGAGAGAGAGASASVQLSAGARASAGLSASFSASASARGGASAGVSATQGAFARLRASSSPVTQRFNVAALRAPSPSLQLTTDLPGGFDIGGRARSQGSSSFHADVGQSSSLQARLTFEED